ncbi:MULTISPECIES: LysR family transcriptional regulator [unclassified Rhizobium]|jgi:DNA-binding transcriptional LysR family regulator|uniref:LysR family transcriptional regulator n=1 Tax=unclassified Rhizobium TaxID=2613769 RepID=UPI001A986551|nr:MULTISPECIES: LysR family transcriptional regulator [unclassified Rhizobium]MBX5157966.1 LysR family transcriptional regulator [Rhizobium sp. NZLR8]MBX5172284.1 LysR family transcriptional regulator [Rhizobium sp. NZLR1b]MBX5186075.1 LysR family transcriptional regulator [Rhizobium sp. NZLR5]MBX5192824.1 LysR family transcriptional regulator [Rhizobium sp. NZLR3b]MBX5195144.1 LysR family transcriptional regulator [Rhizobium sp. NZLR10]
MADHLDLKLLRAFVTVAREGNVTRAAELLHLTQPAISLQLKRLADDVGLTLFRRTASGLELTRDGALLATKGEQVIASVMEFSQTARHLTAQLRGKLRIGTIIDPEFTRLGAFLQALVESGPGIETELRQGMSGEVAIGLKRNELDVGFFLGDLDDYGSSTQVQDAASDAQFFIRPISHLTYRVVAPPAFASLVAGKDWKELAELPWIGTPPASVHHRLLAKKLGSLNLKQNVVALVDQETSMLAMVRTGLGLSLCRESIALDERQTNGLVIADRVELQTTLGFACLLPRRSDPNVALAFDMMDRLWRSDL